MAAAAALKLQGKVSIISGSANGIGAATAKLFSKLGASVSLLDLDEAKLKTVAEECEKAGKSQPKPLTTCGSVADEKTRIKFVEETVKKFGKIDILVNNAGVTKMTKLLESPIEDYDRIFDINVRSVVHLTQLSAPHLIKTQGSVINLASVAAHTVLDGRLFYGMSKATIRQFTKYAAQELAKYNVRVNSISPGIIKTGIFLNYNVKMEELPKYWEESGQKQALQRCGEPDEIAQLIAFLGSDESSFITGTDILIDGGLLIQPSIKSSVS